MATPKKPKASKPAAKSKKELEIESRKLDRNVRARDIERVRAGSSDTLALLRDPARTEEAADLIRTYAMEADPSKPGYSGDEILATFVRAFTQLPESRRASLLDAAGNPPIFSNLPKGYDPLESVPPPTQEDMAIALQEALASPAPVEGEPVVEDSSGMSVEQLARSPSTFAGSAFVEASRPDPRAPIDRTDGDSQKLIERIVGSPMYSQYMAIVGRPEKPTGVTPTLPNVIGRRGAGAKRLESPRGLLRGASPAAARKIQERIDAVSAIPTDAEAEPFAGLMEGAVPPEARDSIAARAGFFEPVPSGSSINYGMDNLAGPEDLGLQATMASPMQPPANIVPGTRRFIDGMAPVLRPEVQENVIARLKGQLAEIERRQAAFAAQPQQGPAIDQRDNLDTLTVGTLGIQGPYAPPGKMTVDRQLNRSAQSPRSRVIEAISRAAQDGSTISLEDIVPEYFYQYPRRGSDGTFEYPAASPSPRFLAEQLASWHGVENAESFIPDATAVLERSMAEQHMLIPGTERAIEAARTRLVPGMGKGAYGKKFFGSPESADIQAQMFADMYPRAQLEPRFYSQEPTEATMRAPQEILMPPLDEVLDRPVEGIDFNALLEEPAEDASSLDDILNRPIEGDLDLFGKTMNTRRSGPLAGLYA